MEVSALASTYLDNYYLTQEAAKGAFNSKSPEDFRAILERAYASQRGESESPAPANVLPKNRNEPIDKTDKLYELCLELETFIVKNLINGMRNTVQKSGFVDDSFAGKMYEDMLYDEYAKDFTKNANFGLAEQAYRQLSRYT